MLLKTRPSRFFMSKVNRIRSIGESEEHLNHKKKHHLSPIPILHRKNNCKGIKSNIRKDLSSQS